jgi:hypothetical protein
MANRKLSIAVAAGAATLAIALPAAAGPPPIFENEYEGRAERDRNTYVGFDVTNAGGARRIAEVTAFLRYVCDDGNAGPAVARVEGRLRVEDGRFRGTLRGEPVEARVAPRGPAPTRIAYRIAGKLQEGGRAKGTIDATLRFTPSMRGIGRVRCYTGELDWRTRRGADVVVPA